jgi:hypothetical protein
MFLGHVWTKLVKQLCSTPFLIKRHGRRYVHLLDCGSKFVTRSQRDYFGKEQHVLFPQKNFYMQMIFWMKFFVTYFLNYLNVPQCITYSNPKYEFLKVCRFLTYLTFHLEKWSKFKSSPKIKISQSLVLL